MNWEDHVKITIQSFREQFEKIEPKLKKQMFKYIYNETLLEPCQVEVSDLGESMSVIWLITHDQGRKDMEVTVYDNIKEPKTYVKDYLRAKKHMFTYVLDSNYPNQLVSIKGILHLFANDFFWSHKNVRMESPYKHAVDLVGILHVFLDSARSEKYHKELEEGAEALKKDVALVQEEDLRSRLEKTSRKIEQTVQEIKRIEEHERRLRFMENELTGVRRLVGTKTFGEWKVLLSEIDKVNIRIDALSDIRSAYDKVLAQQNAFMKQQSEVMKQQSSFIKWIKYATILLPIAVISVPVIEIISIWIRHSLGIL